MCHGQEALNDITISRKSLFIIQKEKISLKKCHFREDIQTPFYVNTPITRPTRYNTTLFPLSVDLYLDPECRYTISATNSFGQTASRIFLQFSHWIPAHIVAILLLAFKYQIKITPEKEIFKCGSLNAALLAGQTFFIITGKDFSV